MTLDDKRFLEWLVERLVSVYGESRNADFVKRLIKIVSEMKIDAEVKQ